MLFKQIIDKLNSKESDGKCQDVFLKFHYKLQFNITQFCKFRQEAAYFFYLRAFIVYLTN